MANFLVVGGSSGIGASLVEKLSTLGHSVWSTYNNTPVRSSLQNVTFQKFDVHSQELDTTHFPEHLDGFAYCPGSINLLPFSRIKEDKLLADFHLHVMGAIKTTQTALPFLKKSAQASVLYFSTVAVQTGFNFHTQVAVCKGAIEGLTRSLAAELAPQIRVNAIAPSITQTPLASKLLSSPEKISANAQRHPLQKVGSASDIAEMGQFLLSEKTSWITGQIITIDGGISALK